MHDGLSENQRAFLLAREHTADFEDLSAVEINRMSFEDFARRTGRQTPAEAALEALDAQHEAPASEGQEQPPAPVREPQSAPQGLDLASMTMEQYAALRGQLGVGGREYGRGALDGGSTADWVQAAQRKAGRSAWQGGNLTEPPRLEGRFVCQNDMRDTRSAAQRFSTPGNAFGI